MSADPEAKNNPSGEYASDLMESLWLPIIILSLDSTFQAIIYKSSDPDDINCPFGEKTTAFTKPL